MRGGNAVVRYQVNVTCKSISGIPPQFAVRWSELIFPKLLGFWRSTVVVGASKLKVFSTLLKSQRIWNLNRSPNGMFFFAEQVDHTSGSPVTMLRPALPGVKASG